MKQCADMRRRNQMTTTARRPASPTRVRPLALLMVSLVCGPAADVSFAAPVHIKVERAQGTEVGAGTSVGKGAECFIVAPAHVVDDTDGSNPVKKIQITDQSGKRAKATLLKAVENFDAALLRVEGSGNIQCPEDWTSGKNSVQLAKSAPFVVSNRIDGSGRLAKRRLFVAGVSKDSIDLEPYDKKNRLKEGDSGSLLLVGNEVVGMVLSVDTRSGEVQAITQSQIHSLFGRDVLPDVVSSMTVKDFTRNRRVDDYASLAARNAAAAHGRFVFVQELTPPPNQRNPELHDNIAAGVSYVLGGKIMDVTFQQVNNPNYVNPNARPTANKDKKKKKKKKGFGNSLLDGLTKGGTKSKDKKHKKVRFFYDYNVDVMVEFIDLNNQQVFENIERVSFRMTDPNVTRKDMEKNAIEGAVAHAVRVSLQKFGVSSQ